MRFARSIGNGLLWVLAIMGVLSGVLWGANQMGLAQPVVVISGSMSPGIQTGDLLIAIGTPIEDLEVDTVATLPSVHTARFVTHRVVEVEHRGDHYAVRMKGDANSVVDDEVYLVAAGTEVWQPAVNIPGIGGLATTISRPKVAIPALIAIVAMILASSIPPSRGRHEQIEETPGQVRVPA